MKNDTLKRAAKALERKHHRRAWQRTVSVLAGIVVFCTTYALILPAITIEQTACCGIEPHQHGAECYEKTLICGREETGAAAHSVDCVSSERRLICENADPEHRHAEACYQTFEIHTCGAEPCGSADHIHTEECYRSNLVCGKEEHTHGISCYTNPEADTGTPDDPSGAQGDLLTQTSVGANNAVTATGGTETQPSATEGTEAQTPGTVKGVTPNGTVINVFDYWLTERASPDSHALYRDNLTAGINNGHALKFTGGGTGGTTNTWTHSSAPQLGLVDKVLDSDGYPFLMPDAAAQSGTTDQNAESLAYLFDPTMGNGSYKQTFRNVGGLLQIDEEGYYYYDSQQNFAELNEQTNQFTLYNTWGVWRGNARGQFFPFNQFAVSQEHLSTDAEINHYFGLTMTSRFVQRYGGHTNSSRGTSTIFEFAGDDDVWVFIDGVLIGDLGGIHDRAALKIDFHSGEVWINNARTTTLKDAFTAAGKATTADEWNGNTFADNTYHTLKFYYLERGNYDSNMMLKYNLTAVPATSIYKVDQYGDYLAGVNFAVYRANETWGYDPNSEPVYTGTTDSGGKLTFVDEDNMPYTLKELNELFGEHCVMREMEKLPDGRLEPGAPPGYRLVNEEVYLHINDRALWCENTYESGVWAMVTLQVSAPPILQLVNGSQKNYYSFDDKEKPINGTLFGIVVKRMGTGSIKELQSWAPVSGNSKDGYTVHKIEGSTQAEIEDKFIRQAIEIAKKQETTFKMQASGAMELTMTNLPGHVTEYLYMIDPADREKKADYSVVYYWTEGSLAEASDLNTYRVNSDAEVPFAFDRIFGAVIEVPNLSNRLLVQKYNDSGELINGAIFALFKANEDGTYVANDGSAVTLVEGQYRTEVYYDANNDHNSYAVIITDDGKRLISVEQRRTNNRVLEGTEGTCVFGIRDKPLLEGCYYLREVQAPPGYKINTTPVMVRVTDQAIYANAGDVGDGVEVARGPGYVVATLHKAASSGDLDNTLTWIYQQMVASNVSNDFAEALYVSGHRTWHYVREGGLETGKILTSYLYYDRPRQEVGMDVKQFLASYEVDKTVGTDTGRPALPGTVAVPSLQLSTDVGWSFNTIYQDHVYGSQHLKSTKTKYTDLREKDEAGNPVLDEKGNPVNKNIYKLFSRSVYVRVTDKPIYSDLEISKEVTGTEKKDRFTFTVTVETATGPYDFFIYAINDHDRVTPLKTDKISNGGTITLEGGQVAVIKGLPGRAKYTVSETPTSDYHAAYSIDGAAYVEGIVASGTLNWEKEEAKRVSKVAFTNTYPASSMNLTIRKYAAGAEKTPLSGAQFVLSIVTDNVVYYYKDGAWVTLSDEVTLETLAHTTDANGVIQFEKIPDGKYTLKEIAPPEGYRLPDKDATFTVSGGKVVEGTGVEIDGTGTSVTVSNSTDHILPATGGIGTEPFTIAGSVLTVAAGILLLYLTKKRRKEDVASF